MIRADEQRVPREGGYTHVRGMMVIWGRNIYGKHLPETLPGCGKKIYKPVSTFAQVSNAERERQGRNMKKYSASAPFKHRPP